MTRSEGTLSLSRSSGDEQYPHRPPLVDGSSATVGVAMDSPCYSARFVYPFAKVLSEYENYPLESLNKLKAIDPAGRIPTHVAHELAIEQVERTGDPDLGLKAARTMPLGCAGALDYAMHSAATVRDAIEVGARYSRFFSDVLDIRLEVDGQRAMVRVENSAPSPRSILDFSMGAWFINHMRAPLRDAKLECWFAHRQPADTSEYERSFAPATLRFDAPFYGFVFDREYLAVPLASANPSLHMLFCEHVASIVAQLSRRRSLTGRAREIAMREMLHRTPTANDVAVQLKMSARTLNRRLEREGTNFRTLLDHMRRDLALRYVGDYGLPVKEISNRLRFSHVEAFYRSFKRWTGLTPLAFRRTRPGRGETNPEYQQYQ